MVSLAPRFERRHNETIHFDTLSSKMLTQRYANTKLFQCVGVFCEIVYLLCLFHALTQIPVYKPGETRSVAAAHFVTAHTHIHKNISFENGWKIDFAAFSVQHLQQTTAD